MAAVTGMSDYAGGVKSRMNRQYRSIWGRFYPPLLLRDKKGSSYYDLIIKTFIVITLLATVLSFLSIFTTYLNLNHICRRVVRTIELEGQVSEPVYEVFNKLKEQTDLSPEMSIKDVQYCDVQNLKIQLRDTFTVELAYNHVFTLFKPSFAPAVQITIPMIVKITGMSEQYWKVPDG